jgi:small subunit ribosomal protein S16
LAVKLRLRRMGKKKQPIYKVVAADARSPRDGKFLEAIGLYNPLTNPHTININEDRVLYWLSVGAQPTDTVKSLLTQKGILLKRELIGRGLSEDEIEAEMSNWAKMKEAKQKSSIVQKKKSKKVAAKEAEQAAEKPEESETKVEEAEVKSEELEIKVEVTETKAEEIVDTKEEESKDEVKTEQPEIKEDNNEESTAEVKGTASEGEIEKKEG